MSENTCLEKQPLCDEMLQKMDTYWRAANYLSAGQLYLLDNPLLRKPLTMDHVKKKIVGHWGTVPGQNFVWTHCNRVIKRYDLDMIYISGLDTAETSRLPIPILMEHTVKSILIFLRMLRVCRRCSSSSHSHVEYQVTVHRRLQVQLMKVENLVIQSLMRLVPYLITRI